VNQSIGQKQVKEKKTGSVNFKGKLSKSFSTVPNVVKSYSLSIEVRSKTLLTSEESLLKLGNVRTSKQLTLVHNNVLTLCFQNRKVWINRIVTFFSRSVRLIY